MNILLYQRAIEALAAAPLPLQKAFIKQLNFLRRNWRFYFKIEGDIYRITDLFPHPK
ncbi:MAG: hypothetical protein ABSG79_10415 [Bryobacteraceae bacterium]|jgi:hypothetical protein